MYHIRLHLLYNGHVSVCFQAQLIDLRSDLYEVRATKSILEKELDTLLLQLHASQLQLHTKSGNDQADSENIKKKLVSLNLMFSLTQLFH